MSDDDYQFEDLDSMFDASSVTSDESDTKPAETASPDASSTPSPAPKRGSGGYATELFSKQIKAKFRTFFIDLKESSNGKFVKISEKSHGRKSTIMMDAEDLSLFVEALNEVQGQL